MYGDRVRFVDVLIRQAHPGPKGRPYGSFEQKLADAERYQQYRNLPWPLLVDDLEGTVHQVYSGLADPTYLIDVDGRVAYFNMWTYGPSVYEAIEALLGQGGRGVVKGGIDHIPYLLPSMVDGWQGIRLGLPQSYIDLETAAPGMATGIWLGDKLRPVLAPVALRAKPVPVLAKVGLAAGAVAIAAGFWRRTNS